MAETIKFNDKYVDTTGIWDSNKGVLQSELNQNIFKPSIKYSGIKTMTVSTLDAHVYDSDNPFTIPAGYNIICLKATATSFADGYADAGLVKVSDKAPFAYEVDQSRMSTQGTNDVWAATETIALYYTGSDFDIIFRIWANKACTVQYEISCLNLAS